MVDLRNYSLEIMSLREIILHNTYRLCNSHTFTVYHPPADLRALLINNFGQVHLIKSESNLRLPQHLG